MEEEEERVEKERWKMNEKKSKSKGYTKKRKMQG